MEHYGKVLAAGSQVGESWEVADTPATSLSGRGGDEARPLISNGLLAGRQLHDAVMCCRRSDQSEGAQGSPSYVGLASA